VGGREWHVHNVAMIALIFSPHSVRLPPKVWPTKKKGRGKQKQSNGRNKARGEVEENVQLKYLKMAAAFQLAWPGFMNFSNVFPPEKRRRPIRKGKLLWQEKFLHRSAVSRLQKRECGTWVNRKSSDYLITVC